MMTFDIIETNVTDLYKNLLIYKNKIGLNLLHILNYDLLKYNVSKDSVLKIAEHISNDLNKEAYKVYISLVFLNKQTCIDLDEIFNLKFIFKEDHIELYKSYQDKYKYFLGIDNYKIDPKDINRKEPKTHTLADLKRMRGYNLNTFK